MSTAIQPYESELRLMAEVLVTSAGTSRAAAPVLTHPSKPLGQLQEFLVELKVCTALLNEWLLEFKKAVIVASLTFFFAWEMIKLHLHPF